MSTEALLSFLGEFLSARRYEIGFIVGALAFELAVRSGAARRLLSSTHLTDLTYCALYRFGIFALLLDRPINQFVVSHLTWQLFLDAPVWLRMVAYLLALDFSAYWMHRLMHSVPWLWAIHQVHHSQDQLTIMATYRNHPVDVWLRQFVGPVVFMVLFGVPPVLWLPLALLWDVIVNLAHLEVNWTYGPFRRLFVSPVFHSIHHSVEDRHQHRNYGANLAIWDILFGTADFGSERPRAVGLPGWRVRESILVHLWAPLRAIVRHYRGQAVDDLAPLVPPALPPAVPDTGTSQPA